MVEFVEIEKTFAVSLMLHGVGDGVECAAGLSADSAASARMAPRAASLCSYVVALDSPLVVEDVARDPRFAGNPVLRNAGMQFYAGVPLRTSKGMVIGALCVMDRTPRNLSASEIRLLGVMADDVMRMLAAEMNARSAETASATAT